MLRKQREKVTSICQGNRYSVLCYAVLLLGAVGLAARSFFGFDWSDEPFYLSLVHRLYQGDVYLVHEWHPTQFFSVLLLPLYTAYVKLHGSTEGVFLFFRLAYVLFSLGVACVLFRVLRRNGTLPALMAALVYLFYAKASIGTLSYNTMSVGFSALALACVYSCAVGGKRRGLTAFGAGVFVALAAWCMPPLIVAYLAGWAAMIVARIVGVRQAAGMHLGLAAWRAAGLSLAGAALVAAVGAAYVLATVPSLSTLAETLPQLFADPAHPREGPVAKLVGYGITVVDLYYGRAVWLILACVAYVAGRRVWKKPLHPVEKGALFLLSAALTAVMAVRAPHWPISHVLVAMAIWGLLLFALTDKRNEKLFACFYVPGMLFSLGNFFASNTQMLAIADGILPAACASMFFLADFADELRAALKKPTTGTRIMKSPMAGSLRVAAAAMPTIAMTTIVAVVSYERVMLTYREAPLTSLTERIDAGPAAGLYTEHARAAQYHRVRADLAQYASQDGRLFVLNLLPWAYLDTDMRCGTFTAWRTFCDDGRIERYYDIHPDRLPTVILVLRPDIGQCHSKRPSPPQHGTLEGYLLKHVQKNGFEQVIADSGMVYRKSQ
ncbi:MAG: hypothetical protein FWE88_06610 [Phycisphaerae bacterium]|nr:hypothetical protein [Phycisphaerae bacterium]